MYSLSTKKCYPTRKEFSLKNIFMKNLLFLFLAVAALFSCEKTVELDIEQAASVVIIEGLVTNRADKQYVKISRSRAFGSNGATPTVSGAEVTVSDEMGQVVHYEESVPGWYTPVEPFTGRAGITYYLTVKADGQTYTAEEEMQFIPPLDSLAFREDTEEKMDPEEEGRYYEVLVYGEEPQETEDYYLFKFYRNDTLFTNDGSWVFAYDDTILGERIHDLPTPMYYAKDDWAKVEMYAITRQAYRYYIDLSSNINNDGGMFSGQPANTRTNIEGGAIGYFQASVLQVLELQVGR